MNGKSNVAIVSDSVFAGFGELTLHGQSAAMTASMPTDGYGASVPGSAGAMPAVFGRYRVEGLLGRGGMGSVYLAHDEELGRPVALKIPRIPGSYSPKVLARLKREARSVAALQHPNIRPVYDAGEIDGIDYLAMAYIKGCSLADYLKTAGPQPERAAVLTVLKIARALEEAHRQGILHRDLKPANIMIDVRGEPIVTDFGLACSWADEQARLSHDDLIVGTPAYMAPEQIDRRAPIGPASDIYSLGVVLYELLTQRCPFEGSVVSVAGQCVHAEPPAIESLRENVSPELAEICRQAMAKNPAERFGSMQEFADALAALLRELPPAETAAAAVAVPALEPVAESEPLIAGPPKADASLARAVARTAGFEHSPRLIGIVVAAVAAAVLAIGLLIDANRFAWPVAAETDRETTTSRSAPDAPPSVPIPAPTSDNTEAPRPAAPPPAAPPPAAPPERELAHRPPPVHGGPPPEEAFRGKTVEEGFACLDRDGDGVVTPRELPLHIVWRGDQNDDDAMDLAEMRVAYARHEEVLFSPPTELERLILPLPPHGSHPGPGHGPPAGHGPGPDHGPPPGHGPGPGGRRPPPDGPIPEAAPW